MISIFPSMNIIFMCSNIPVEHVYELYISQLIWCSWSCGSHWDSLDIGLMLTGKLVN